MTREKHPKRFRGKTENGRGSDNINIMRRKKNTDTTDANPYQQDGNHKVEGSAGRWRVTEGQYSTLGTFFDTSQQRLWWQQPLIPHYKGQLQES